MSSESDIYNNTEISKYDKSDETHISLSYKTKNWHFLDGNIVSNTFTLFYNNEKYQSADSIDENGNITELIRSESGNWNGVQWTINVKKSSINSIDFLFSNSKMSLFYGSQRGGLICANGVCAVQPEFIDGVKFSFSKTF